MIKLKKITIENFRGIKNPIELDFSQKKSIVIYGRNGTGKSSIVDAWEWINNNYKIGHLNREGVFQKDYPNKSCNGNNSYIDIQYQHSTAASLRITHNKTKPSTPKVEGDPILKNYSPYPNYLRYSELQDFVYKTKTDKYKYIAKFFGLEIFLDNQSELQTYINKLLIKIGQEQAVFNSIATEINNLTSKENVNEIEIVNFINVIALKYNIPKISKFIECNKVLQELIKLFDNNPKVKELNEWREFKLKLNQFYPTVKLKNETEELEVSFKELKQDEATVTKLILSNLYKIGQDIIPKLENQSICPLCDTKFLGDLEKHVQVKHRQLEELNKKKTAFDKKQADLFKKFTTLSTKLTVIQSEKGSYVLSSMKELFDDIKLINNGISDNIELLTKQVIEISSIEISTQTFISKIDILFDAEKINKKKIDDIIISLESDESTKALINDLTNLQSIIKGFIRYQVNSKKLEHLNLTSSNFNALLVLLNKFINDNIKTIFEAISKDVADYFNILETTNSHLKNPEIKLLAGKDKAVELEIEFALEKVTPAFKYLSESQVNSFGLAIFLAAVKHFNHQFKFIILDDVISSFDSFKRPRVINLLKTKFQDFQILLLTHDDIFFKEVMNHLPEWNKIKFTGWDYTTGPKHKLGKNYHEEILKDIEDDEPQSAGHKLGKYLEWFLGDINENIQGKVPFRRENSYSLSELFQTTKNQLEKKLKLSGQKKHKLIELLEELEKSSSFRNFCDHYKNESAPYTAPEIKEVYEKWLAIEALIHCKDCKGFIKLNTANDEVHCTGNHINMKNPIYYS